MPETHHEPYTPSPDPEVALLQRELSEAYKTIGALTRQLGKEQQRHAEIVRAHKKTIENLAEAGREHAALEQDLELWRSRAENAAVPFKIGGLTLDLTPDEARAIRKAMARLHHPDAGGDAERMKAWNAALDPLEG
ncbi:MAG TPA: hypothetical protein PKK15_09655 [Kouleothrix sp.]|uniref:hypothetical protein n=1 Tax=Kouleothrix sp. TaxID=2779161 RepID=UPI002CFBC0D0|nr:hypothetical protein [Kouleothrix sp.]